MKQLLKKQHRCVNFENSTQYLQWYFIRGEYTSSLSLALFWEF